MAESKMTKKALAASLKELMKEVPFSKITISDIATNCGMSRKSFYYHFKDKYDLVNWIFEDEFITPMRSKNIEIPLLMEERLAAAYELCCYFYENKDFYSKIFKIEGQNCFTDYFRELLTPIILESLHQKTDDAAFINFSIDFYLDAAISALRRWIIQKNTLTPMEFLNLLKNCVMLIYNNQN